MNIYTRNFRRLEKIFPNLREQKSGDAMKLEAGGFMALHFDCLQIQEGGASGEMRISLAHYFEQNGDLCCDPDMEIRLVWKGENGIAEALTFQQAIPPIYQEVYPSPGKMYPKRKRELNAFLETWLQNILKQGHKLAA